MVDTVNKFNSAKIYKIISPNSDKIYIGSSIEKYLSNRIANHKKKFRLWNNNKENKYCTSYKILECGDASIVLLENFNCNNRKELHTRERFYIEQNKDICINKNIPTRTNKEYKNDYKEYFQGWKRGYNSTKHQCSCSGSYTMDHRAEHYKTKLHLNHVNNNNIIGT